MSEADAGAGWRPTADRRALELRARALRDIREFFDRRGVLEVTTPVAIRTGLADSHIESLRLDCPGSPRYLHTSPEFAMKRLLAAGSGDIYQICPVFRGDELGRRHNPEFTLLEWYRTGFDEQALMDEVVELLAAVLQRPVESRRISYRQAFLDALGVDPLTAADADLVATAERLEAPPPGLEHDARDAWLDWLMSTAVAPGFDPDLATLVHAYPASQCALARIRPGSPPTAARFEVYWGALELANGYHELTDRAEQAARFEAERDRRRRRGEAAAEPDARLLAALAAGLPDCAGVALGVDRLLMLAGGYARLDQVLSFAWERA